MNLSLSQENEDNILQHKIQDVINGVDGSFNSSEAKIQSLLNYVKSNNIKLNKTQIRLIISCLIINQSNQNYQYLNISNVTTEYLILFGAKSPCVFNCYRRNKGNSAQEIYKLAIENGSMTEESSESDEDDKILLEALRITYKFTEESLFQQPQLPPEPVITITELLQKVVGSVDGTFNDSKRTIATFIEFIRSKNIRLNVNEAHLILACYLINKFDYPWEKSILPHRITRGYMEELGARIPSTITNQLRGNKDNHAENIYKLLGDQKLLNKIDPDIFTAFVRVYKIPIERYPNYNIPELSLSREDESMQNQIITTIPILQKVVGSVDGTFDKSQQTITSVIEYIRSRNIRLNINDAHLILACYLINKFDYPWENAIVPRRITRGYMEELGARIPSTITNQLRANTGNHAENIYKLLGDQKLLNKIDPDIFTAFVRVYEIPMERYPNYNIPELSLSKKEEEEQQNIISQEINEI